MGLFTIHFELGGKTRETLAHIADASVIQLELGPETRAMIERIAQSDEGADASWGTGEKVLMHFAPHRDATATL